jgi:hypothetical protein
VRLMLTSALRGQRPSLGGEAQEGTVGL